MSIQNIIPRRVDCKAGNSINNKYIVDKTIGEGSFGCVYKIHDLRDNMFAMKLLRLWDVESSIRQALIERFEMEFKTGQITSKYLVNSFDYGFLEGNPYIVMEFCPGGDLTSAIGKQNVDFSYIANNVLEGLRALHINGKVHRDLKPENVLYKEDGTLALTDFGIAGDRNRRMTERNILGRPKQIFGTYAYMPPEQLNRSAGGSTVRPTTDIFSFGVMMYQLITGILPFGELNNQNDLVQYKKNVIDGRWDKNYLINHPIGNKWVKIIEGCLRPDFKDRFQSAKEVQNYIPHSQESPENIESPIESSSNDGIKLVVTQGKEFGKEYNLTDIVKNSEKFIITVGRDDNNSIIITDFDDSYISRKHFTIETDGYSKWIIRDGQWIENTTSWRKSSNGTFLNSIEITPDGSLLKDGDIIFAGNLILKVCFPSNN